MNELVTGSAHEELNRLAARFADQLEPIPSGDGFDWTITVNGGTTLLRVEDCTAVIAGFEAAMVPATETQATAIMNYLLGSYPNGNPRDPETYVAATTAILREYPADIGTQAAKAVLRRCKFLPTNAELTTELESLVRQRRHYSLVAEAHSAEHERRSKQRRPGPLKLTDEELAARRKHADYRMAQFRRAMAETPDPDRRRERGQVGTICEKALAKMSNRIAEGYAVPKQPLEQEVGHAEGGRAAVDKS